MKQYLIVLATCMLVIQAYGQQYGSFKDSRDGSIYKTVKIGEQVWMAENLNASRFRNGDIIPEARTPEEWEKAGNDEEPAWCYYENDSLNGIKYGKLYNWYAVNDSRGLAPDGYHIPSDNEWKGLDTFLGGEDVAWKKLKSSSGWSLDNGNGNNKSGFSGLPGGARIYGGISFDDIGLGGYWWSSKSNNDSFKAEYYYLFYNYDYIPSAEGNKDDGFSVRCLKD